jgi:hypothetical protein
MAEQAKVKWNIERVELVLFNLEHKRWQIWQEHSPQSLGNAIESVDPRYRTGAVFRRQIIRLLSSVRNILAESIESSRSHRFLMGGNTAHQDSSAMNAFNLSFSTKSPCTSTFWELFLDYCDLTCNKYGITSSNVRSFFQNKDFRDGNFEGSTLLTRDDAADIISALPVAADWDLFGCWYRSWTKKSARCHFPPSANGAADWDHPFYMARISQRKKPTYLQTLRSTRAEAICCDLGSQALIPIHCEAGKFFGGQYCSLPRSGTLTQQTYLAYAYLYDHIQTARGFKASYIISLPIDVYDRTHFLQIQIVPEHTAPSGDSLGQLWVDWIGSVHQTFWIFSVKQYLEEEVQRLSLAYFESRWEEALSEELKTRREADLETIKMSTGAQPVLSATLASTAHLLLPLDAVHEVEQSRQWSYRPYSWDRYSQWRQTQPSPLSSKVAMLLSDSSKKTDGLGPLGAIWGKGKPSSPETAHLHPAPHCGLEFGPDCGDDALPGIKNIVVRSRIDQLVDLHYDRMSFQLRQMIAFTKDQRAVAKRLLRNYFSDARNRNRFNGRLSDELAKEARIENSELSEQTVFALMCLAVGHPPGEKPSEAFAEFEHRLLQQPVTEITSAFFSLGAAKTLTHLDRWTEKGIALNRDEQRAALTADLDRLVGSLRAHEARHPALGNWIEECVRWAEDVKIDITDNFTGHEYRLKGALATRYKMLRWPLSHSGLTTCVASMELARKLECKPFFGAFSEEDSATLTNLELYFPFSSIARLGELIDSCIGYCKDRPGLKWWDAQTTDRLFASNDGYFKVSDIILKTRVVVLHYESSTRSETAIKIATASQLNPYFTPFARDFGRVFVFSGGTVAEVTPWGDQTKDITSISQVVTRELSPRSGDPLGALSGEVAFAFVWRVFEEGHD